jgi:hypothetical protein
VRGLAIPGTIGVVRSPLRPWLLITPLSLLGVLGGHELTYLLTRTPQRELHEYLGHLPEVCLLLALLTLIGASLVERGARIVLWPFPAVAITGFVVQEHVERIAHTGSVPFLLDSPAFVVGLGIQLVVAIIAFLCARLLIRVVGSVDARNGRAFGSGLIEIEFAPVTPARSVRLVRAGRSRAPPIAP